MPNTYVALATQTVAGTSTNTISFTSIPATYTNLRITIAAGETGGGSGGFITFNNDGGTGSLYSFTRMVGDGSTATSARGTNRNTNTWVLGNGIAVPTTPTDVTTIDIMNYSNTTTNKTALVRENNAASGTVASVILWRNTAAINRVDITYTGANFANGSTFSLYGIANADQGDAKATGGIITEDANYWYHTFAASGAFIPKQSLTCDVLVVAGGGGGGYLAAGGGGAGGFLTFTSQSVSTAQTITVGSGGAGGTNNIPGFNGSDSQFGSLTLVKGGGGGGSFQSTQVNGLNGGSGGGASGGSFTGTTGGSPTSGQGFAGGNGYGGTESYYGGGGGGAGAAGGNSSSGIGGSGGIGSSTAISGGATTGAGHLVSGTYYFSGGGGGADRNGGQGIGGSGGGGNGGSESPAANATDGLANTGGGGGGPYNNGSTGLGKGGSGIVIVRYAK